MDEFYLVKYGNKEQRFDSRDAARAYARRQALLPYVQRLRNGNGSMDLLCDVLSDSLDSIAIDLASVDNHIKKYVESEE